MSKSYSELVLNAPFLLVKGFLLGFLHGRKEEFGYFFHHKSGIRRETVGEMVRELLSFECHSHLCLENRAIPEFKAALKRAKPVLDVDIEKETPIDKAEFRFSCRIYNEELAEKAKKLFEHIPQGVTLDEFTPVEHRDNALIGVKEYAQIHPYSYEVHGYASGSFEPVMGFYLMIKKSQVTEHFLCGQVHLIFEKEVTNA